MRGCRLVNIVTACAFRCKIAGRGKAEIKHCCRWRFGKDRCLVDGLTGRALRPLISCEIKFSWIKRAIAACCLSSAGLARLVIIGNVLKAFLAGRAAAAIHHHQIILAKIIEQRAELLLKQRQPMLHASQSPPVRHRLIERVLSRGRTEHLAITPAKTLDTRLVNQRF